MNLRKIAQLIFYALDLPSKQTMTTCTNAVYTIEELHFTVTVIQSAMS